jgi:hypothetical protein
MIVEKGGVSPFFPRYGFGCDMVSSFSVVLANGDIVNANAEENPDLMVALKGGLNNFGIVVRFDMKVFQQGKIWGGYIVTPITALDANLAALVSLYGGGNWNPYLAVEQSFTFSAERGGLSIVSSIEFTDPSVEEPSDLMSFTSIKPTYRNTMRLASLSEIARENQQLQSNGIRYRHPGCMPKKLLIYSRQTFCTTSFYLHLEHLKAVYSIFHALLPSIKEIQGMRSMLTYRCLHPSMLPKHPPQEGIALSLALLRKFWWCVFLPLHGVAFQMTSRWEFLRGNSSRMWMRDRKRRVCSIRGSILTMLLGFRIRWRGWQRV